VKVYTIGYAKRDISDLINILRKYGITLLVDVRRFPKSKYPEFEKENLKNILEKNGLKYVFLGENLGGFIKGGYKKYMETQKFKDGFKVLLNLIRKETVVLMCREKNVKYCHRRFIASLLENLGVEVIHII